MADKKCKWFEKYDYKICHYREYFAEDTGALLLDLEVESRDLIFL